MTSRKSSSTSSSSSGQEQEPQPLNLVLAGDSMVGKTALCESFVTGISHLTFGPTTLGKHKVTININEEALPVVLWDTSDVEQRCKIHFHLFAKADCVLLNYAVNNRTSYDNITSFWEPWLQQHCPTVPTLLVGTKTDFRTPSNTHIPTEEGKQLQKKIKAKGFIECTSKSIGSVEGVLLEAVSIAEKYRHQQNNHRRETWCRQQ